MYDIVNLIKNLQTLTENDSAFNILKDFERVLDNLDMYVFKNWQHGELYAGPEVNRYTVTCKFVWPYKNMPDPEGAERLIDYGCDVQYQKTHLLIPRKVHKPEDFRPGTKKGKIDPHPIWLVTISMPKKLMQDIFQGYKEKDSNRLANLMKNDDLTSTQPAEATMAPQQGPMNVQAPVPPPAQPPV